VWEVSETAKDPVCGMQVDEKAAKFWSMYRASTYYFCSEPCKRKFELSPRRFVAGVGKRR